jgi:hypothetical protein
VREPRVTPRRNVANGPLGAGACCGSAIAILEWVGGGKVNGTGFSTCRGHSNTEITKFGGDPLSPYLIIGRNKFDGIFHVSLVYHVQSSEK